MVYAFPKGVEILVKTLWPLDLQTGKRSMTNIVDTINYTDLIFFCGGMCLVLISG